MLNDETEERIKTECIILDANQSSI